MPLILVVIGTCASGKSEVGTSLSNHFNCPFLDADTFHSHSSVKKMELGISLTDEDRIPWLERLVDELGNCEMSQEVFAPAPAVQVQAVLACSALKKSYRDILRKAQRPNLPMLFVFLDCSKPILQQRILSRQNHFMKINMLDSQLAILEDPSVFDKGPHEFSVTVNGDLKVYEVVECVVKEIEQFHIKCM